MGADPHGRPLAPPRPPARVRRLTWDGAGCGHRGRSTAMRPLLICGVDTTGPMTGPLAVAAELARRLEDRLLVAHVRTATAFVPALPEMGVATPALGVGVPVHAAAVTEQEAAEAERAARESLLGAAQAAGAGDAEVLLLQDVSPAAGLRRLAAERGAAIIVVGTHGHGVVRAALVGSTAHALVGDAPCPVLLVPSAAGAG